MFNESRKRRKQFKFLNIKLLHNQSSDNYVKLLNNLLAEDYVVSAYNTDRQIELLDFKISNCPGVYVGKI